MPIPASIRRRHYGKHWQQIVRPRILDRAGYRCEACGKPNGAQVKTATFPERAVDDSGPLMIWRRNWSFPWQDQNGERVELPPGTILDVRTVRVVLTVAHLNHQPGDDRDENLRALCQWCHLYHDYEHHKQSRAKRKDHARPLLAAALAPGESS